MRTDLPRQFTAYAAVGVIGTVLDFALLWLLLRLQVWSPLAVTGGYMIATALQFFLNRQWSFKAFERPAIVQAPAYIVVTVINWGLALLFVEGGVALLHLTPLAAKALSLPPSALVGFFGNRHLTFGPGLMAAYRAFKNRP